MGNIGEGKGFLERGFIREDLLERMVYWRGDLVERGACWRGGLLESGKYWRGDLLEKGFIGKKV